LDLSNTLDKGVISQFLILLLLPSDFLWLQGVCVSCDDACFSPTIFVAPLLGGRCHSCLSPVRLVAGAGAVFIFFAGGGSEGVRWLLIRYVTPLPSLSHTALAKPSLISSCGTWPPMRFRGHSDQPQPFSRLFQQMIDCPVLSGYFGSPGNSYIGVLHAWQSVLTKMQKSFARRGSISALILGCLASRWLVNAGVGLHPCWYWAPC
jgi:hypothetical protein